MVVGNDRGGPLSIEHLVHCLHIRDSHSHSASWKLTTQYSHCSTSYLEVQSNLQINPIGYLPLKIIKRNFFNESTIIRIIRCKKLRLHIVLGHGKMRPMKPLPKVRPAFVALHQRGRFVVFVVVVGASAPVRRLWPRVTQEAAKHGLKAFT